LPCLANSEDAGLRLCSLPQAMTGQAEEIQ